MDTRHVLIMVGALLVCACALCCGPLDADEPLPKPEPEPVKPKTVTIGKVVWYVDYDQAMAIARKTKKPLWLHFGENPG